MNAASWLTPGDGDRQGIDRVPNGDALLAQLEQIASDLGRLRRRLAPDEFNEHLLDRISGRVETIDAILQPTAADIYHANLWEIGDEARSVTAALEDVDARARHLRRLLRADEQDRISDMLLDGKAKAA